MCRTRAYVRNEEFEFEESTLRVAVTYSILLALALALALAVLACEVASVFALFFWWHVVALLIVSSLHLGAFV